MREVTLYFRQGSSDKVYTAKLNPWDSGKFTVDFAYGRRGSTLTTGTKTQAPIELGAAEKIFEKLIAEKKAKGYIEGEDAPSYTPPPDTTGSDVQCLLLTPVDDGPDTESLIQNAEYIAEEKFDGIRLLLAGSPSGIIGYNRKGKPRAIPRELDSAASQLLGGMLGSFMLDGELVGGHYYAFDLLEADGSDIRSKPLSERYALLSSVPSIRSSAISIANAAGNTDEKAALVDDLRKAGAEGVVFKPRAAKYLPGRQPDHFKLKFVAESSVIVTGLNAKASVSMGVFDERGNLINVGNCSLRGRYFEHLKEGDIIDVRYLYAYRGGSLFQPRMIRTRDDLQPSSCHVGQLQFKREEMV